MGANERERGEGWRSRLGAKELLLEEGGAATAVDMVGGVLPPGILSQRRVEQ